MKCKVCGAKIRDGAEFCENCGMKVADGVPYTPSINNRPQYVNQRPYKKPWYKKWWIWTILGILIVLVVCAVCFLTLFVLANNNNPLFKDLNYYYSETVPDITIPYATAPYATVPDAAEPDATTPSTAQFNSVYKAGETCDADGLKITLEKTEDYESDKDYIQPEKGRKFIRVYFNIKNETGTDMYVSSYGFACYADDFKCEENYMGENITESYGAISNGRSTKLCLCYEVPVNAESIEVEYKPMSAFSSNIYSFKVK